MFETFARRLSRLSIAAAGGLRERQGVATFGHGTYSDGFAFDAERCVWITSIVSNRVIRVDRDGAQVPRARGCDPAHVEWGEHAYLAGALAGQGAR